MKTTKKNDSAPRLTGEQIVQKKLDDVNAVLKRMDLSKLTNRRPENKA